MAPSPHTNGASRGERPGELAADAEAQLAYVDAYVTGYMAARSEVREILYGRARPRASRRERWRFARAVLHGRSR